MRPTYLAKKLTFARAGPTVFTIVDASGNWSKMATDLTIARVVQAGAMPIDTYAVPAELMRTWHRPDAMGAPRSWSTILSAIGR